MIALPSIAGQPAAISSAPSDRLAARCVLALAGPGPIPKVRTRNGPLEHALLKLQLEARLFEAAKPLEIFRVRIHAHLGSVPTGCECSSDASTPITVWLSNMNGRALDTRWVLERRWKEIERDAPGLAATALETLDRAKWRGAPLLTPSLAVGMAQWTYWMGESDESLQIEEMRYGEPEPAKGEKRLSDEEFAEQNDLITRARIDKVMPPCASAPKRMPLAQLQRLALGRGRQRDLARRVEALWYAVATADRRKHKYSLHTEQDELWALGYPAMLRWNGNDPMGQILDDHAQRVMEGAQALEEAWGWFIVESPEALPGFFADLAERLAIARMQEQVVELIADRRRNDE